MRAGAVVLAAGKSERMGGKKLLIEIGGRTLIDRVLDVLDEAMVDEVVVVLGHKPQELLRLIEARGGRVKVTVNKDYEEGMTSSFKAGLRLIGGVDAAFLVLGDQLLLETGLLKEMIWEMERHIGQALIVSPVYRGKKGHPVLFSRELFDEILGLGEGEIVRDVIHRHADSVRLVEGGPWTVRDIDTPEDLEEARRLLGS